MDERNNLMEKIVSLAKRRGFIFPGSEIYGGLAGTWDCGPFGVELKNNIKKEWWRHFVCGREDIFGVDTAILMNSKVWEASGHLGGFFDVAVDCKKCRRRFRVDQLKGSVVAGSLKNLVKLDLPNTPCPDCGAKEWGTPGRMGGMFKTYIGVSEDESSEVFLRPETAQGMFVNFKNVIDSVHPHMPFGIAQIGKAFRNEVTPGNFIFRTREFEQMEIEYFVREKDWEVQFAYWLEAMHRWAGALGIKRLHDREVPDEDRAHYSKRTVDLDFDFPFGREELYGLAYRTDFDLKNHSKFSGVELAYYDEGKKEKIVPHVIEPTFGVDRTLLALLVEHYSEDGERVVLKLPPRLAPTKVAVFPLLANKPALVEKARVIFKDLKTTGLSMAWDDRGNIGKRYYAQDEIGTPWCVTVDHQTLEDDTVTVRDRDTTRQERVVVKELVTYFMEKLRRSSTNYE